MTTVIFLLTSALPALFWALRAIVLRHISAGAKLLIDLVLLILSAPLAIQIIGWDLNFPANPGDHSPGLGVVFMLLFPVWLVCAALWFVRVLFFAYRKLKPSH